VCFPRQLVHSGDKQFQCELCDVRFIHKHNLKQHMKIHGRAAEGGGCRYCSFRSASQLLVRKHELTHQLELLDQESQFMVLPQESDKLGKKALDIAKDTPSAVAGSWRWRAVSFV
jgi:hypothetical protein